MIHQLESASGASNSSIAGRYVPSQPVDAGVTFLRQARPSQQLSKGVFYQALTNYIHTEKKEFLATGLEGTTMDSSRFKPSLNEEKRIVLSHDKKVTIYVGVPKEGEYDVIAIVGNSSRRPLAASEMRIIGARTCVPLVEMPHEEGRNYFNLSQ